MKIFTYIAIAIALGLIVFNLFQIDFSNPFEGESTVAFIGIIAGVCAILLLLLLRFSKMIVDKTNE
jgi:Mg2+ and Co2+ transporter CorA